MTDLRELADFMEEQSHTSGDHHIQAAVALRELNRLKTEVHPSILKSTEKLVELWHIDCSGRPDLADDMFNLERVIDAVVERAKQL